MSLLMFTIIIILFLSAMKKPIMNSKIWNGKKTKWLLSGYGVVLLLSLPVYFVLQQESEAIGKTDSPRNMFNDYGNVIYEAVRRGEIDSLAGTAVSKKWEIPYDQTTLDIASFSPGWMIPVFVEKQPDKSGDIEIHYFAPESYVDGIKIPLQKNPPEVKVSNGELNIRQPKPLEIELVKFDTEFTIDQFTRVGTWEDRIDRSRSFSSGGDVLYIRVPDTLEVTGEFQWVIN